MKTKKMYREWLHLRRLQGQIEEVRGKEDGTDGVRGIAVWDDEYAIAWQDLEPLKEKYEFVLMVRLGIVQRKAVEFCDEVNYMDKKLLRPEINHIAWKIARMFNVPALSVVGCEKAYRKATKMLNEYERMRRDVYRKTSWRIACNGSVR